MPLTRVYLALDAAQLRALADGGTAGPAPLPAHAVTSLLGRPGLTVDQEELEHTAWLAAVDDATALASGGSRRRVVAAADVDSLDVSEPGTADMASRVEVAAPLHRPWIVSFHVDEEPGAEGVADLLWYDVTELDAVCALLAD